MLRHPRSPQTHSLAPSPRQTLQTAIEAAHAAGRLMRLHHRRPKKVNLATRHDLKLELDVRCQRRIETMLRRAFPTIPILGEEGVLGDPQAPWRWVVDPIDGTVNFAHGIPHCCTSIALQFRTTPSPSAHPRPRHASPFSPSPPVFQTVLGVVYDPFCDELFTAQRGQPARLNGRPIRVSSTPNLAQSVVGVGFAKNQTTLRRMIPIWDHLIHRARKVRIMGAAALGLAYVAAGRLDAYLEYGLSLWDIAAGSLLVDCAGGLPWQQPIPRSSVFHVIASNRPLQRRLELFRR